MTKLLNTRSNEFRARMGRYIRSRIDLSGYDYDNETLLHTDKMLLVKECYEREYCHNETRFQNGSVAHVAEWLSGLPSSIEVDFTYCDIIETAKRINRVDDIDDATCERIVNNWFQLVASNLVRIWTRLEKTA